MEDVKIWKERAIARRVENKELSKRHKELKASRDKWKSKYLIQKERAGHFQHELAMIKKKLIDIVEK